MAGWPLFLWVPLALASAASPPLEPRSLQTSLISVDGFVDDDELLACLDNLLFADANLDLDLEKEEYADFIALESNGKLTVPFAQLDMEFVAIFYAEACTTCYDETGDDDCCVGDKAHINLAGDDPDRLYSTIVYICGTVNEQLQIKFPDPPTPSPSSVSAPPITPSLPPAVTSPPTENPTAVPTTASPSSQPSPRPSSSRPSHQPSPQPTTVAPTNRPTSSPVVTASPTSSTSSPTLSPVITASPTSSTTLPTMEPSPLPTLAPTTDSPSPQPTSRPSTSQPSLAPSRSPSAPPSPSPSQTPSVQPSLAPSSLPTVNPDLLCVSFSYQLNNIVGLTAEDILEENGNTLKTGLELAGRNITIRVLNETFPGGGMPEPTGQSIAIVPQSTALSNEAASHLRHPGHPKLKQRYHGHGRKHRTLSALGFQRAIELGVSSNFDAKRSQGILDSCVGLWESRIPTPADLKKRYLAAFRLRRLVFYTDDYPSEVRNVVENFICPSAPPGAICVIVQQVSCVLLEEGDDPEVVSFALRNGLRDAINSGEFEAAIPPEHIP